jgi:8-oxo-dGTP pyrophosphatase MutT (NUDIX family)
VLRPFYFKIPQADLGEDIQKTAVREVFEETGIEADFCSVIGFRQQHNYPTAHGRSDLYVICRLEPRSFEINADKEEIKSCQWIDLDYLLNYSENNLTRTMARLINYGKLNGFDKIDIKPKEMSSPFRGRFYNLFFRQIE